MASSADQNCWSTFSTWRFVHCLAEASILPLFPAHEVREARHFPHQSRAKKHGTRNTQPPMYEPDVWVQPRVFLTVRCRKSPEYECNCVITLSVCLVMQYLYTHSWAQFTERFYRQWAHLVPTLLKWISNGWYQGWAREKQDDPWTIYRATKWERTKNKIKWWR